jgi:glycosyltransferase involved in cell wall biosynthesis
VNGARLRRELARIHAEAPISLIEGAEAAFAMIPRAFPVPKVIRLNGGHHFFAVTLGKKPRPWRSFIERRSFRRADHICAVSQFVADQTRPLLGLDGRPIEVLPNPVDVHHFQPTATPVVDGEMVFVGTLTEKKGVRQLVLAMPRILEAAPHARLVLVGRDTPDPADGGSYAAMLRSLLPPALASRIEFKGHVSRGDLPGILARASVAVFPSHMESQGLVIVEAMAAGKPVVTGMLGPGPEIVEHGISGMLCDPHDPESIADQVVTLLGDSALRARVGLAARVRAEQVFSENALVARTESFYARCVASGPRARVIGVPAS